MDQRERDVAEFSALKAACAKSHKLGPGGARVCICGAACGGSAACNALAMLRTFVRYAVVEDLHGMRELQERINASGF